MKKLTKLRMARFGTIISGLITLLIVFFDILSMFILPLIFGTNYNVEESGSIGIIGGSDGPTAIFMTGMFALNWKMIFLPVFLITSIVCAYMWGKLSKSL